MSSDRICHLSDLNAAESRIRQEIADAESAARCVVSRLDSFEGEMDATNTRVHHLISDVRDLSGSVADHRQRLYALDDEMANLQQQQDADYRRLQKNRRMLANLRGDLTTLEKDVAGNHQAIAHVRRHAEMLQREANLAQKRIEQNSQHIQQLQTGVQQINDYLESERQRIAQDRRAQMADAQAQSELASILRDSLDAARVGRFGLESAYRTTLMTLKHAEDSTQLGRLEAARATYQAAQRDFAQVARDVDTREREYNQARSRCEATLKQVEAELKRAATDDMRHWHLADLRALQTRFETLSRQIQNREFDHAGRPEQVITALEQLTTQIAKLQDDVTALEQQLDETIQKGIVRVEMLQRMAGVLMDLWGDNDFPIAEPIYAQEGDPKTTMKVQTVRPNRPNVTLYLDLDGTVRFHWTGYVGMECAKDIAQFEERLRSHHQLELAVLKSEDKPGQPNPDLTPPPPGLIDADDQPKRREERRAQLGSR